MERTLEAFKATEVPPGNKPVDPRADPKFFDYTWTNWWDYYQNDDQEPVDNFMVNPEMMFKRKI
jgi:hypothetical protein